jgi:conjugative relaxase-like TrwC/TraI family protein
VLTISRLSRWSINYYNDTARQAAQAGLDRRRANGGLGEYYSQGDSREPTWLVAGDTVRAVGLVGLDGRAVDGGTADPDMVQRWLDDGIAPNGAAGRGFSKGSVHGFDLTFAAPKSVSLLRALTDDRAEKAIQAAHQRAIAAAMTYLAEHAGYTRVHNPLTGMKDLQRLPGLVGIAYQHETSRCGDPHLHTHVIVPNRQARADGALVSIDSKSLFHEAKAAGVVYQAVLRHELHAELMLEWAPVDPFTGMAEIAAVPKESIKAWSRRASRLRDWAHYNLVMVDGAPTAQQLAAAQKATRPAKPENTSWAQLQQEWRADARGLHLDRAAHQAARAARRAEAHKRLRARLGRLVADIDKAACTRADLVEWVGALMPVDAPGDGRALIEQLVDAFGVRISAAREAHHREGHEMFTVDAVIAEEARIFDMVDAADTRARLDVRAADLADLSADQARAIAAIAHSPHLVQPLQAPAGAGKTHSLRALRAVAHRTGKQVLVLAPTGKAVDEAMHDDAGDRGFTFAKALQLIEAGKLKLDRRTVIVVDEASMVGTPELRYLLAAATAAHAKLVLVGDSYQLAPVKPRGGMFEHLCDDLPWAQRLSEVWRMRDPEERDASLALRSARANRLRRAIGWYRSHDRVHTGDQVTMAADATAAYIQARAHGKDVAICCDAWEMADAINQRLHDHFTDPHAPSVPVARDQQVRAGDLVISRQNDATLTVQPAKHHRRGAQVDQVSNGNRWQVIDVDATRGRIAAERITDSARVIFDGDYRRDHITLGYASTVHATQGMTIGNGDQHGICWTILSDRATRAMAYVGMTRARDENHLAIYPAVTNEAQHHNSRDADIHQRHRGTKHAAAQYFRTILTNDDRARTMHTVAARTDRELLPTVVAELLERNDQRCLERGQAWRHHVAQHRVREAAYERITATRQQAAQRQRSREQEYGLELEL